MTDYSIDIIKDTSYTIELNEQGPQGIQGERGIQGPEGPVGPKGDKGDVGEKGDTGVSVIGVEEISKVGLVTTYRMLFSNGEYFDYQVTDGSVDGLTREIIINKIWGYDYEADDRTIDAHIKLLRSKLKNYRDNIKTIRKVGYKFEYRE